MQVERMAKDPTEYQVARHLETYLLWLFGWVMFTSSHGNTVDARWIAYARAIADTAVVDVPQVSCGSTVLCATYRTLCHACVRTRNASNLTDMPLSLQLWSFERFQVGRPLVVPMHHTLEMYAGDDIDKPTMGSLWKRQRVRPL